MILLGTAFVLIFSGMWLSLALGSTALVVYYFLGHGAQATIGNVAWHSIQMYPLVAVGCFILMGQIILRSGVGGKIFSSMSPLVERLPGGLLHTNIFSCALFAAVFGSSAATAAVVGSTAVPELRGRGYDKSLILGSIAAGGTLGLLIPPSAAFIIYGALTETSVGALFAAGIIPGIILAVFFSFYILIKSMITHEIAPRSEHPLPVFQAVLKLFNIWPVVVLLLVVLIPIFAGWATATEASGLGVVGACILGKLYGKLTIRDLVDSVKESTHTYVILMFVVFGAMILANSVGLIGLPRKLIFFAKNLEISRTSIMLAIITIYLGLGCLFDGISFVVMTLPFVFPIVRELGYGNIWFGVFLTILVEIGQLTPPVGINLFVVQAIAGKETSLGDVIKGIWPFFWILLGTLALLMLSPEVATFFPRLLGYEIT